MTAEIDSPQRDFHWVAHRGYSGRYPENSRASFLAAVRAGANNIELDIQLTRDLVPVLLHDSELARQCNEQGLIQDLTLAEALRLDMGHREAFGDRFRGTRLLTLREFVNFIEDYSNVSLFVEIKEGSILRFGEELVIDRALPLLRPILGRCTIISFVADVVREIRRRFHLPVGWCVTEWSEAQGLIAEALNPEFVIADHHLLPASNDALWPGNWNWMLYVINEAALVRKYLERGFKYFETDMIGDLKPLFSNSS